MGVKKDNPAELKCRRSQQPIARSAAYNLEEVRMLPRYAHAVVIPAQEVRLFTNCGNTES